jgi:hypothetical protein
MRYTYDEISFSHKKPEILKHARMRMDLKLMPSERNQIRKITYCTSPSCAVPGIDKFKGTECKLVVV